MNKNAENPETLRKYLLGELSETQLEEVEDGWMTREEGMLHLKLAEEELIDDYVAGELSGHEAQRFEEYFLIDEGRRSQLAFSRALKRWVDAQPKPVPQTLLQRLGKWLAEALPAPVELAHAVPVLTLAVALLLVGSGGVWSTMTWWQTRGQLDRALAMQASLQMDQRDLRSQFRGDLAQVTEELFEANQTNRLLADQLATVRKQPSLPVVVTALLKAGGLSRGGGETPVSLRPRFDYVELRLDLGIDDFFSYRAVLSSGGRAIITWHHLKAVEVGNSPVVKVSVPSHSLPAGSYTVVLFGASEDGQEELFDRYSFQVTR